jgi:hypothetical protein
MPTYPQNLLGPPAFPGDYWQVNVVGPALGRTFKKRSEWLGHAAGLPIFTPNCGSTVWKGRIRFLNWFSWDPSGRMDQEKKVLKHWIKSLSSMLKGEVPALSLHR